MTGTLGPMVRPLLPCACLLLAACADRASSPADGGDPRCVNGECPAEERDCSVGTEPFRGTCRPIDGYCERNGDCPEGQLCDRGLLRCVEPPTDDRRCGTVDDCFADERCLEGYCRPIPDSGLLDAATDSGAPDPAAPDGSTDAGAPDASVLDARLPDAAIDGPAPDATSADGATLDAHREPDGPDPDARSLDAALAAAARPDAAELDVPIPDALTADVPNLDIPLTQPDGDLLDLAVPDGALPDGPLPDVPLPDAAPPEPDGFVPPPTPPRGVYEYERLQIPAATPQHVAFHPSGDYFVVAERTNVVHVVEWPSMQVTTVDPTPNRVAVYWNDLRFDPSGDFALLVGEEDLQHGVVYRFDHAAWEAGEAFVSEVAALRQNGQRHTQVAWPWDGGNPVLLSKVRVGQGWNARLRDIDPETMQFGQLGAAQVTAAGCHGLGWADNEFGGPGIYIACGDGWADHHYYTWIAGQPQWRVRPGSNDTGNLGSVAAHPEGDYALVVSTSGRRVRRFQDGVLNQSANAPNWSRQGIWNVTFQQEGQRALVVGRAGVAPVRGTVIEYRHDEYACPVVETPQCGFTNVDIPAFDVAPYNADGNVYLHDADFRPGCDGGAIVGHGSGNGYVIRFDILNGRACPR